MKSLLDACKETVCTLICDRESIHWLYGIIPNTLMEDLYRNYKSYQNYYRYPVQSNFDYPFMQFKWGSIASKKLFLQFMNEPILLPDEEEIHMISYSYVHGPRSDNQEVWYVCNQCLYSPANAEKFNSAFMNNLTLIRQHFILTDGYFFDETDFCNECGQSSLFSCYKKDDCYEVLGTELHMCHCPTRVLTGECLHCVEDFVIEHCVFHF